MEKENLNAYLELKKYHNSVTNSYHLSKKFPNLSLKIIENSDLNYSGQIYCYINNMTYPICDNCKTPHKFISFKKGFNKHCPNKCKIKTINYKNVEYLIIKNDVLICEKHKKYMPVNKLQKLIDYNVEELCEICSLEKRNLGICDKSTILESKKNLLEITKDRKMIPLEIIKINFPQLWIYTNSIQNIKPNNFLNKLHFVLNDDNLICSNSGCNNIVAYDKLHKPKEICENCNRKEKTKNTGEKFSKEYWTTYIEHNFNKKINNITIDNDTLYVKKFCEHGDLNITKKHVVLLKNRGLHSLCEDCNKSFYKKENINLTNDSIKTNWNNIRLLSEKSILINYPYIWGFIDNFCKEKNVGFQEGKYMINNNIEKPPKCLDCDKVAKFSKDAYGYLNHCEDHITSYKCSFGEIEIKEFLDSLNINYIDHDRKKLNGQELDFYIPNKNLGIEYNGLYWHSDINKDKFYHYNKWKLSKKNGVQLITIWEDDWRDKRPLVESILLNKLGLSKRLFARNTKIRIISSIEKKNFLLDNHIQGNCQSSINLGLFYGEELVSLMTFGKKRMILKSYSQTNYEYELLRFCNKRNISVIGGASKLFSFFIKNYNPSEIISYANLDISNGNLYETLGFNYEKHTGLNYWWANEIRHHRSNFMKHRLIKEGGDPNKSANDIMREKGYIKIWGAGNLKYIWHKK